MPALFPSRHERSVQTTAAAIADRLDWKVRETISFTNMETPLWLGTSCHHLHGDLLPVLPLLPPPPHWLLISIPNAASCETNRPQSRTTQATKIRTAWRAQTGTAPPQPPPARPQLSLLLPPLPPTVALAAATLPPTHCQYVPLPSPRQTEGCGCSGVRRPSLLFCRATGGTCRRRCSVSGPSPQVAATGSPQEWRHLRERRAAATRLRGQGLCPLRVFSKE